MTVCGRGLVVGGLHSQCKGPEVGTVRGQCGRVQGPCKVSGLSSLVMGKPLLGKPPVSCHVPGTFQGGTRVWCHPRGPRLSSSQDHTRLAARGKDPGDPLGRWWCAPPSDPRGQGEGREVTFLRLRQRLLQLPHAALGLGTLALRLTQPAAQARGLEVPVVLGGRTQVRGPPGGGVEGPGVRREAWGARAC